MTKVLLASLGLSIAACASVEPPTPAPREAAFEAPAARGRLIGGEKVARVVTWPDAADPALVATLDRELQTAVAASPLPVLLPTAIHLPRAKLMHGEHWWALWAEHDGITLTINASGIAKVYPHLRGAALPHTVRGVPGLVTQNEAVWSASWVEHGVAYQLGIECTDPKMSRMCRRRARA
jgi:hypothetical protein